MGRGMQLAVLGAAVVGSVAGSLAALRWTSPARSPAARPPRAAAPSRTAPPIVTPLPSPPPSAADAQVALTAQMRSVLARFAAWSHAHAGAPCPDAASLGVPALDPWGHALALTCTDQPADQKIGVISAGPNGAFGDDDDLPSWSLGPSVTSLVRGPRWTPSPAALASQPATRSPAGRPRKPGKPGSRAAPSASPSSPQGPITSPTASPGASSRGPSSATASPVTTSPAPTAPVVTSPPSPPPPIKPSAPPPDDGDGIPARR